MKHKKPKRSRSSFTQGPHVGVLVRMPPALKAWVDDTAAKFGLSRDAFLRLQLSNLRDGFKLLDAGKHEQQHVFERFESELLKRTEQAVQQAVEDAMKRPRLKT